MKRIPLFICLMVAICSAQYGGAQYLVICPNEFLSAVQPLVEWKHEKGLITRVFGKAGTFPHLVKFNCREKPGNVPVRLAPGPEFYTGHCKLG